MLTLRYLLLLMCCCLWKWWGEGGGGVIEEGDHLCHVTLTKIVMWRTPPGTSPASPPYHPHPPHQSRQCWPFWRCYVVLWTNLYSRWNPWSREHIEGKLSPILHSWRNGWFPSKTPQHYKEHPLLLKAFQNSFTIIWLLSVDSTRFINVIGR